MLSLISTSILTAEMTRAEKEMMVRHISKGTRFSNRSMYLELNLKDVKMKNTHYTNQLHLKDQKTEIWKKAYEKKVREVQYGILKGILLIIIGAILGHQL